MATLYLIRHGEPELRGVFLGQMNSALSAHGHERASGALRGALRGVEVAVVYTSPLLRARQTAEYIGCRQLIELPDLLELDHGEWTGRTWPEIEAGWGGLARRKSADWLGIAAPGGEPWPDLLRRAGRVRERIRSGPEPCAVVAHQGVNAAIASLFGPTDPLHFQQQYGEVIRIEYA
jgi:broad specificity phosphatase PhoE